MTRKDWHVHVYTHPPGRCRKNIPDALDSCAAGSSLLVSTVLLRNTGTAVACPPLVPRHADCPC